MNDRSEARRVQRHVALILAAVLALYALLRLALGPLPQDPTYHLFADTRTCFGIIPRAGDVLTNLAILAAGLYGVRIRPRMRLAADERPAANTLIAGAILTACGSAYYHWAPTNATLVWDRLPMMLVFMPVTVLVMADRLHPLFARYALWPLTLLGAASVVFWGISERLGDGDVRLYLTLRVGAAVGIALLVMVRPPRRTGTTWLVAAILAEGLLLACERFDYEILGLTGGLASGHNLKHVTAGLALGCIFRWLQVRRALPPD